MSTSTSYPNRSQLSGAKPQWPRNMLDELKIYSIVEKLPVASSGNKINPDALQKIADLAVFNKHKNIYNGENGRPLSYGGVDKTHGAAVYRHIQPPIAGQNATAGSINIAPRSISTENLVFHKYANSTTTELTSCSNLIPHPSFVKENYPHVSGTGNKHSRNKSSGKTLVEENSPYNTIAIVGQNALRMKTRGSFVSPPALNDATKQQGNFLQTITTHAAKSSAMENTHRQYVHIADSSGLSALWMQGANYFSSEKVSVLPVQTRKAQINNAQPLITGDTGRSNKHSTANGIPGNNVNNLLSIKNIAGWNDTGNQKDMGIIFNNLAGQALQPGSMESNRRTPPGWHHTGKDVSGDTRVININLNRPMIENFSISSNNLNDGLNDIKHKVEEVLLEILNSANAIQ